MTLRDFTTARVGLGRSGDSLPTRALLDFQLAHARARDAVHAHFDAQSFAVELRGKGWKCVVVRSGAADRATYLRRPDLGRRLSVEGRAALAEYSGGCETVFVVADGLSALAVQRHASAMLQCARVEAPVVIVEQGRVAIGDEIGEILGAELSVVLIGERPGLSSPDSMGVYLTYRPRVGLTDADRNCISNVRDEGLSYEIAAHKLRYLMDEAVRRKLSGVLLREEAGELLGIRGQHPRHCRGLSGRLN